MSRLRLSRRQADEAFEVHEGTDHRRAVEARAGSATAEVCRKHGISPATFYQWKAKFGGLEVSETRSPRMLGAENARLRKLLAEAMLNNAMLKDVAAKWWRPVHGERSWRTCVSITR